MFIKKSEQHASIILIDENITNKESFHLLPTEQESILKEYNKKLITKNGTFKNIPTRRFKDVSDVSSPILDVYYRPLNVLPTVYKIFERIMQKQISYYIGSFLSSFLCRFLCRYIEKGYTICLINVDRKMEILPVNKQVSSDCNWTPTHNHLVRKRIPNHLTKLAKLAYCLRTKWLWVRVQLQSLKFQISRLF